MELADISKFGPAARQQILDKLGKETKSKYHAEKARVGKMRFDSRKESARYQELMLLRRAGKIRRLKVQPEFTLQEAYMDPDTGDRVRAIRYRADFSYERETAPDANGMTYWLPMVEDVKSPATHTRVYLNKAKMMREKYGITIREI